MLRLGRIRSFSLAAATLLCAVGMIGCDNTPSAPTPTTTYQGNWFGTTSQGLPISFTVTGNAVTSISFSYTLFPTNSCIGNDTGSTAVTLPSPLQITSNGFSFSGQTLSRFDITGVFSSGTAASGTIDYALPAPTGGGCSFGMGANGMPRGDSSHRPSGDCGSGWPEKRVTGGSVWQGARRASPVLVSPLGTPLPSRPHQIRNPQGGTPIPPRSFDSARWARHVRGAPGGGSRAPRSPVRPSGHAPCHGHGGLRRHGAPMVDSSPCSTRVLRPRTHVYLQADDIHHGPRLGKEWCLMQTRPGRHSFSTRPGRGKWGAGA
jgi:hypothetical protein